MIICSCNVLTDRDIQSAAPQSDGTAVDCYRCLGVMPVCGKCLDNAQALIDQINPGTAEKIEVLAAVSKPDTISC